MARKLLWVLGGLILLAAIGRFIAPSGDSPSSASNTAPSIPTTEGKNKAHDMLAAAPAAARRSSLAKAVSSAGEACPAVSDTLFWGFLPNEGDAYWVATCEGGKKYMVSIKPDANGSTSVMSCVVAAALKLDCSRPASAQ